MPLFKRKDGDHDAASTPHLPADHPATDIIEETLEFTESRRGYDRREVETYIQHTIAQHEQDLDLLQQRLVEEQAARHEAEKDLRAHIEELEVEADAARRAADEYRKAGAADVDLQADLVTAHGRIAELEQQVLDLCSADTAAQLTEARAELEDLRAAHAEADATARQLRETLEVERAQLAELREHAESGASDADTLAKLDAAVKEAASARGEAEVLREEVQRLTAVAADRPSDDHISALQAAHDDAIAAQHSAEQRAAEAAEQLERCRVECEQLRAIADTLESVRGDARSAQERAERFSTQLDASRTENAQLVQEAARAQARVELLTAEITQLRQDREDFGESARRMVKALNESREQQEAELRAEREQALAAIEQLREEARQEAERVRMAAFADVEAAEQQRQLVLNDLRARARQTSEDLERHISDLAATADSRAAAARDSETEIRAAVRRAAEQELDALRAERQAVEADIVRLTAARDELQTDASRLRRQLSGWADGTSQLTEPFNDTAETPQQPAAADLPIASDPIQMPVMTAPAEHQGFPILNAQPEPAAQVLRQPDAAPVVATEPVLVESPQVTSQADEPSPEVPAVATPIVLPPVEPVVQPPVPEGPSDLLDVAAAPVPEPVFADDTSNDTPDVLLDPAAAPTPEPVHGDAVVTELTDDLFPAADLDDVESLPAPDLTGLAPRPPRPSLPASEGPSLVDLANMERPQGERHARPSGPSDEDEIIRFDD